MFHKYSLVGVVLFMVLVLLGAACSQSLEQSVTNDGTESAAVHVGYFPNLTHATALAGVANGTFQQYLGKNVAIDTKIFNAGTEEMEALFAGEIDVCYIGPSPAVNGFIKSNGEALRVVAGSMANGVAVVGTKELAEAFKSDGPEALRGARIATPSYGNTQDVALRAYLAENNLTDDVEVIPLKNADQLTAFAQGDIDGAWAPEPWASRLIQEAGASLLFTEETLWPEKEFTTTLLVVRTEFLEDHPELVRKWIEAHVAVTNWIAAHPADAQATVNDAIGELTSEKLDPEVLSSAWKRLSVTTDPLQETVIESARDAEALGFIEIEGLDLEGIFDTEILDETTAQQR